MSDLLKLQNQLSELTQFVHDNSDSFIAAMIDPVCQEEELGWVFFSGSKCAFEISFSMRFVPMNKVIAWAEKEGFSFGESFDKGYCNQCAQGELSDNQVG